MTYNKSCAITLNNQNEGLNNQNIFANNSNLHFSSFWWRLLMLSSNYLITS